MTNRIQHWHTQKKTKKLKSGRKGDTKRMITTDALSAALAMTSATTSYHNQGNFDTDAFRMGLIIGVLHAFHTELMTSLEIHMTPIG